MNLILLPRFSFYIFIPVNSRWLFGIKLIYLYDIQLYLLNQNVCHIFFHGEEGDNFSSNGQIKHGIG